MDIEFGDKKEADNLRVHKLSLALSVFVLETRVVEFEDDRHDYGERRMIVFGYLAGRLHCCVYTMRGTTYRIISLRKANDREQAKWAP